MSWPKILWIVVTGLLVIPVVAYMVLYSWFSHPAIAYPQVDHYHLRLQVIDSGKAISFADKEYQVDLPAGVCKGGLTAEPFHFHDNEDQLVHVHWQGVTGKQMLGYYGYGSLDSLGYRLDNLLKWPPAISSVKTHSSQLSSLNGKKLWIYTGDEIGYKSRIIEEFLLQDINVFLGKKSQGRTDRENKTSWLETPVYAHGGIDDEVADTSSPSSSSSKTYSKEELETINDLVGNIVIFTQDSEPKVEEVQAKFANLIPLKPSACGG
jgi:hypothetical protein